VDRLLRNGRHYLESRADIEMLGNAQRNVRPMQTVSADCHRRYAQTNEMLPQLDDVLRGRAVRQSTTPRLTEGTLIAQAAPPRPLELSRRPQAAFAASRQPSGPHRWTT
jgi:hypothetical protein